MDMISKGRGLVGDKSPSAKVSNAQVEEIKKRYVPRCGVGKLAGEFGISPKHVWAICHEKVRVTHGF